MKPCLTMLYMKPVSKSLYYIGFSDGDDWLSVQSGVSISIHHRVILMVAFILVQTCEFCLEEKEAS